MIATHKVKLGRKELFSLSISRYLKKRWWLLALLVAISIMHGLDGYREMFEYLTLWFTIFYPIFILAHFWRFANSQNNGILSAGTTFQIEEEKLSTVIDGGSSSTIDLSHFVKAEIQRQYYLLFVSKGNFVCIPFKAFQSEEDRTWFVENFFSKIGKHQEVI